MPGTRLADFRRKRNRGGSRKLFFFLEPAFVLDWPLLVTRPGVGTELERIRAPIHSDRSPQVVSPLPQAANFGRRSGKGCRGVPRHRTTPRTCKHPGDGVGSFPVRFHPVSTARSTPGLLSLRHPQRHPHVWGQTRRDQGWETRNGVRPRVQKAHSENHFGNACACQGARNLQQEWKARGSSERE